MIKNKELSEDIILKLCKKAGIKSISNDSYDKIREIIDFKLDNILSLSIMLKNNDSTPRGTFMVKDLKKSLNLLDYNIIENNEV